METAEAVVLAVTVKAVSTVYFCPETLGTGGHSPQTVLTSTWPPKLLPPEIALSPSLGVHSASGTFFFSGDIFRLN